MQATKEIAQKVLTAVEQIASQASPQCVESAGMQSPASATTGRDLAPLNPSAFPAVLRASFYADDGPEDPRSFGELYAERVRGPL